MPVAVLVLETRLTELEVPAVAGTATEMTEPQTPEVGAEVITQVSAAQAVAVWSWLG